MCDGIAVGWRELPDELIERHGLHKLARSRGDEGGREFHFHYRQKFPRIPAWVNGQLLVLPWGNQQRGNRLPLGGECTKDELQAGSWSHLKPQPVDIPAIYGLERGVWYQVQQGLRGVLIRDQRRQPRVYVLTRPATHYFHIMTRAERMPVLINQDL